MKLVHEFDNPAFEGARKLLNLLDHSTASAVSFCERKLHIDDYDLICVGYNIVPCCFYNVHFPCVLGVLGIFAQFWDVERNRNTCD